MRFAVLIFSFICSMAAVADEIRPALLQIQQIDQARYEILWKVPAREDRRLQLDLILDGELPPANRKPHFIAGSYLERWQITRPQGIQGLTVSVAQLKTTLTDVIIRYENLTGELLTARLSASTPAYQFSETPSFESVITTYTELGIEHILSGTDHLLFVACLVLIAGFTRKLFWAISGFTLAHSITLALSSLGLIVLPIAPLEAVIALSIVFLAVEIAKKQQHSLTYRYPVVVSASFGLLHGFGFAAVLAEIGLPKSDLIAGLLFFNVGVEIGQLLFIAAMLLVLTLLNKIKHLPLLRLEKFSSYIIGSIAMMWCIERVLVF